MTRDYKTGRVKPGGLHVTMPAVRFEELADPESDPKNHVGLLTLLADRVERQCESCGAVFEVFKFQPPSSQTCANCIRKIEERELEAKKVELAKKERTRRLLATGLKGQKRIIHALGVGLEGEGYRVRKPERRFQAACAAALMQLKHRVLGGVLVLSGPSGAGKSTAAAWSAWRTSGRFCCRDEWAQGGPIDLELVTTLCSISGVVVLDDALQLSPQGPVETYRDLRLLQAVLKRRYEAQRPTIVTTQISAEEAQKHFGSFGEALVRMAREGEEKGAPKAGGWIRCL